MADKITDLLFEMNMAAHKAAKDLSTEKETAMKSEHCIFLTQEKAVAEVAVEFLTEQCATRREDGRDKFEIFFQAESIEYLPGYFTVQGSYELEPDGSEVCDSHPIHKAVAGLLQDILQDSLLASRIRNRLRIKRAEAAGVEKIIEL